MIDNVVLFVNIFISLIILIVTLHLSTLNSFEDAHYSAPNLSNTHVAGLILARGGSKGIRHKNLAKVSNVTLLGNSLQIIAEFGKFNSVWVSTDDDEIALEARKFNANVHLREAYTATDSAPSILAVKEFIKKHPEVDIIGLIQCTSPFLKNEYLKQAFTLLEDGYNSVFSVSRQYRLRWKINEDGTVLPVNFSPLLRPRRQDWTGEIVENGMFYFSYSALINATGSFQSGRLAIVEVPQNESLEIDSPTDLIIANALIETIRN